MSDMCTTDGHYILQSVMEGQRSGSQSQSRLEEIIQERPENKEWRVWRSFYVNIVTKDQTDLLTALVSGQKQFSHRNAYGHSIIPVRIRHYIEVFENSGCL